MRKKKVDGGQRYNLRFNHKKGNPMSQTTRHSRLIILGSGPAGYTAAVYAAR
jgi:alkyl hydroperoxide reductase subunit AhpF